MQLIRRVVMVASLLGSLAVARADKVLVPASSIDPLPAPHPSTEYADSLSALSPRARDVDASSEARYSYCVRSTASYECLSYGADGEVRKTRTTVTAHGTAFGYRRDGDDTLLLTNEHVAEWPAVTDDEHVVGGVPVGCKKVGDVLKIVADDHDDYPADDIPLVRVVADVQLDVAVLRAHARLQVLPWKIGRSAALRERTLVEVKGFPLGAFAATSVGKVTSAYNHDDFKDWDHDDFVVDALLSPGNSGSPVLAISSQTGEFELVGIYHAHYAEGSALHVVVGIDQIRDLITTLKRSPRPKAETSPLDRSSRESLARALVADPSPFFAFGSHVASVTWRPDGVLVFAVYSADFPVKTQPVFVALDEPGEGAADYGAVTQVLWGGELGLKSYARGELDAETQAQVARVIDGLRRAASATFEYRAAAHAAPGSRVAFEHTARLERSLTRTVERQRELARACVELPSRLPPASADAVTTLATLQTEK